MTLEAMPSALFDALAIPGGEEALEILGHMDQSADFVKEQYRHCKPILALGKRTTLLETVGVPTTLPSGEPDPGLLLLSDGNVREGLPGCIQAIGKHRHFARELDPPAV